MGAAVGLLAKRFLLSKHSDRFLSYIAWVSVGGVLLGVLALTLVTSVINGFENELVRVITGMNGDIVLYSRAEPLSNSDIIELEIRKTLPSVQEISPAFITELMISGPLAVSGAVVQGFDSERVRKVTLLPERVFKGRLPQGDSEVAVGAPLAEKLGAQIGDDIRLIIPFAGEEEATPKVAVVKVVGLVRMGMYEYDSKFVFMPLNAVQSFLSLKGRVTGFNLKLRSGEDSRRAADKLTESFGYPFRAKDWGQLNRNLFYAIKLEKVVIAIILTVIMVVAAFNVVSTLMMMIHDKSKEIAILKAMGFRSSQSFVLFCMIGTGIGAVGTSLGVLGGLALGWLLQRTQWIQLPADIYYINFLPVLVRWEEVTAIALGALLISFLATLYPAWSVSRREPLEGLRYE